MSDVAAKLEAMVRRVVREESPAPLTLGDVRRVVREELPPIIERLDDEKAERRAGRMARRLDADSAKLGDEEVRRLLTWLAANRESLPPRDRTPERWLNGKTRNPRRTTVARWWTDKLERPEGELLELLGDDQEVADS